MPAIGLGCMGMSEFCGASSEAQNLRVLERAAAIGRTFWDTSDMWAPFTHETLLSKALDGDWRLENPRFTAELDRLESLIRLGVTNNRC